MIGHRVVLRPRSIAETGDLASVFIRRHPRLFLRLLPWVLVPGLAAWAAHAFGGVALDEALALEVLVSGLGAGVYTVLCGDLMLRSDVLARDASKRFVRQLPAFGMKRVLSWLVLPLTLFLGYGWSAFVPEAVLLERGSTGAAMSRSAALLRATPGRVMMWACLTPFVLFVGALAGELFYHSLRSLVGLGDDPRSLWSEHASWAPFVGVAIAQPYLATMRFLLYIDCRTRREGWDLQVQMNALVHVAEAKGLVREPPPKEAA